MFEKKDETVFKESIETNHRVFAPYLKEMRSEIRLCNYSSKTESVYLKRLSHFLNFVLTRTPVQPEAKNACVNEYFCSLKKDLVPEEDIVRAYNVLFFFFNRVLKKPDLKYFKLLKSTLFEGDNMNKKLDGFWGLLEKDVKELNPQDSYSQHPLKTPPLILSGVDCNPNERPLSPQYNTPRNIYLAGKITNNDWRVKLVDFECCTWNTGYGGDWKILENSILKKHHYIGPFLSEKEHNNFGGGISDLCLNSINACDLVFAWIDDIDCTGTIFELGYAKALGKEIYLCISENLNVVNDKLWFLLEAVKPWTFCKSVDDAIQNFCHYLTCESPIETSFFKWAKYYSLNLIPQYEMTLQEKNYRIDFVEPFIKMAFEIDGHEYHKTKEQRTNDASKDRALLISGWKVIRFTGSEIYKNAENCVFETKKIIETYT